MLGSFDLDFKQRITPMLKYRLLLDVACQLEPASQPNGPIDMIPC